MRKPDGERYKERMEKVRRERELCERKKELYDSRAEVRKLKREMRVFRMPATTKVIVAYILTNCTVVEAYSMWIMNRLQNLDALYALITAVITESISFAVYCAKAYAGKKQEELVKLEREKMDTAAEPAVEELNPEEAMG